MKLEELAALCAGSVALEINPHRSSYQSVDEYLDVREWRACELAEGFERHEPLIELQFYPTSPVGFVTCYGNTIEGVLALAAAWFQDARPRT